MNNSLKEFNQKFLVKEFIIFETEFWKWSLRPHQATLGASIISLKRSCNAFSLLNKEEFEDLYNIISMCEPILKSLFNYDKINYLMLMMVDEQVHYHVIPRYETPIELFNEVWKDSSWPGLPNLNGEKNSVDKLKKIKNLIISEMN